MIRVLGARAPEDGRSAPAAEARRRAAELAVWLGAPTAQEPRPAIAAEPGASARREISDERRSACAYGACAYGACGDGASADPAEALLLRIQVASRGEIAEQAYGPSRRWALLDEDGRCVETADSGLAASLAAEGRLLFDRFEGGAAVFRVASDAAPEVRAAYHASEA